MSAAPLACPQCRRAMDAVVLEGHYGQRVEADVCGFCHLVWFDAFESVRLSGLGWVQLLRHMQATVQPEAAASAGPLRPDLGCARCHAVLKPVHNLTRFGRFAALECPHQHGHVQTFSLLLAERGLVRPLQGRDVQLLKDERRTACCLNCGAPIESAGEACTHCASPLVVIDMPRLMNALLVRHGEPVPEAEAQRIAWACRGCGAPLDPTRDSRCDHCGHTVVVPSLIDLRPLLDAVEPVLKGQAPRQARPHGQRLRELQRDHRATALYRYLQRWREDDADPALVVRLVGLALAALFVWWLRR